MVVYISGGITGVENYGKAFERAEEELKAAGHTVINPAGFAEHLPQLTWEGYLTVDIALLSVCEAIYMLNGWKNSRGANREYGYALAKGIKIIMEEDGKI